MSVGLHDVTLAVHHGHSVHIERNALYRNVAALVCHLSRDVERRLVREVHGVALRLRVDEAQLLGGFKLMYAECRHNHIGGSVAGIRQRTYLIRTVGARIAAIAELCRRRRVGRTYRSSVHHSVVHVVLRAIV